MVGATDTTGVCKSLLPSLLPHHFLFIGKQYFKRKCNLTQWGEKKPNMNHAQHKSTRQAMPRLPRENKGDMWDTRCDSQGYQEARQSMCSACEDLRFENVAEIKQKEVTSLSVKERHALTRAFSECRPALHCWPGGQLLELSVQTAGLEWPLAAGLC